MVTNSNAISVFSLLSVKTVVSVGPAWSHGIPQTSAANNGHVKMSVVAGSRSRMAMATTCLWLKTPSANVERYVCGVAASRTGRNGGSFPLEEWQRLLFDH